MIKIPNIDYFANGILCHCHGALTKLHYLKGFHSILETTWENIEKNLDEKIQKSLDSNPKEHHDDIIESYSWDFHLNNTIHPSIHRESVTITLFSFFEHQLNDLCKDISSCLKDQIKLKDLHGQGIERAQTYLSKIANFDWSKVNGSWGYLKSAQRIRNLLVHNGGRINKYKDKDKDKLLKFIESNKNLRIETVSIGQDGANIEKRIIIDAGFINELLENMELFFKQLDSEVLAFANKK